MICMLSIFTPAIQHPLLVCLQIAVMSDASQSQAESSASLQRKHIASLTHSEMIMLNLTEIQALGRFAFDLVISEEEERKIHAFQYEDQRDAYLLMVPECFYASVKNGCRMFVEMLCLCSQTITLPIVGGYYEAISSLLGMYCLKYRYKKGKNVVKLYLNSECWVSHLDFVTFQAVQFKEKNVKELISMKKSNSFQYCLSHFKEALMPQIYTSQVDSIETILEHQLEKIGELYRQLSCEERFSLVYELMNEKGSTLKELQKQIESLMLTRQVTTVPDQEYDSLINHELEAIVTHELSKHKPQLKSKDPKQTEYTYMKIVYDLLQRMREDQFEINDEKYFFITSKIVQSINQNNLELNADLRAENGKLERTVDMQQGQIERLNSEIEGLKAELERKKELEAVAEQKEETLSVKRSTSDLHIRKETLTIKDLKEPLQLVSLNLNTPITKSTSKLSSTLTKTNQKKLKATVKKRTDIKFA